MADATRQRVERLRGLEAEALAAAGYGAGVEVPPDVRERCHMAAVLRVSYEATEARLLAGQTVTSDELLRVTEAINALLPAKRVEPLTVRFVDCSDEQVAAGHRNEEGRLRDELAAKDQQLREAHEKLRQQQATEPSAPTSAPSAPPAAHDNIVPISADSSWSALAAANSHLGNPNGVLFDASDPSGRRSGKL